MRRIHLGPFVLTEPIGKGGMGEVWRGIHAEQGVPVAVKVVCAAAAREPRTRAAFRNEVRAVAGLNHPGIVMVSDYGEVDSLAQAQSRGRLASGSPYLAMELASKGSLKDIRRMLPWFEVRQLLLSLLDALAHAHARGVIHRDIKPGNILLSSAEDLRPGIKLTDFGLAHAVDASRALSLDSGTPRYMAPEQFQGRWRDFGPWTDLYALGCLGWRMTTGNAPFHAHKGSHELANAHLSQPLPDFAPKIAVPEGYGDWLVRLLQKDTQRRFQRAADAAWELANLPDPDGAREAPTQELPPVHARPALTLDGVLSLTDSTQATDLIAFADGEGYDPDEPTWHPAPRPPLPPSWKRPLPPTPPVQLLGAGLGLYGLRTVPLVDRIVERDLIWDMLADTLQCQAPRLVVLQGAAGNGKTRLVEWMSQRAHEVGACTVLKALHGPAPGPTDGLGPMVARHYHCVGLRRGDLVARLEARLRNEGIDDASEWMALAELVQPAPEAVTGPIIRLGSPEERYALAGRMVHRLAEHRPVMLWLDDVQWGGDALAFATAIMDQPAGGAVLIVATAQEEALAERDDERAQLEALLSRPGTHRLAIGPLGPGDHAELVRVLLGFEGSLADKLIERTGGNPLFAVQLVGDWVSRGVLVPTPDGFALAPGEEAPLPDDLHEMWSGRLDRMLHRESPMCRTALELAAALGQVVEDAEWRAVCSMAGASPPAHLLDLLRSNRLALITDNGWSFAHGMLRESLQRLATETGRWTAHNLACALALAQRPGPGVAGRIGRHYFAAKAYDDAVAPLRRGVRELLDTADHRVAASLLGLHDEALEHLGPPQTDVRWGEGWLLQARVDFARSDLDASRKKAERAVVAAERNRWEGVRPRALKLLGDIARSRGELSVADKELRSALTAFDDQQDERRAAACRVSIAHTLILGGRTAEAREMVDRAHAAYRRLGGRGGEATCLRFLGDIARLEKHWDQAAELFERSATIHTEVGNRSAASSSMHGVAEMNRLRGRLAEAEAGYRKVLGIEAARGESAAIPRLNLSLCLLARERYAAAQRGLERLRLEWEAQRKPGYLAVVHGALAPCAAGLRQWSAYDHHFSEMQRLLARTGMVDIDVAQCAERACELAERARETDRARVAAAVASEQWDKLGDPVLAATWRGRAAGA